MTGALKPYPAYRDSGVPWLGEAPKHWEVRRMRNVADMRVSNVDKHAREGEEPVRLCNYVDVYKNDYIDDRIEFMKATSTVDELERFRLKKGDVLITKDSEAWDDIGVPALVTESASDVVSGYHLALLRPRVDTIQGSYLFHVLQSASMARQFHVLAKGVTRYGLSHADIKSMWLPLPPPSEQAAIARYLDHVSERIDRYIGAKKWLISLLQEQKQAIITCVVTRGLDPNAPMKPTGIDWMPEVPTHWETRRLKTCIADIVDMTGEREPGDIYIALEHVESWTGRIVDMDFDTMFESQVKRFQPDDVLFGKLRPYLAKSTRPDRNGVCVGEFLVLRPRNDSLLPAYLEILLRSKSIVDAIDASTFGAKMPRADWQFIGNMRFPVPPLSEQASIVEQLERSTAAIDAATDRARRQIDLLREYRERLINDVVTGKLDVREARLDMAPDADALEDMERTPLPRAAASAPAIP